MSIKHDPTFPFVHGLFAGYVVGFAAVSILCGCNGDDSGGGTGSKEAAVSDGTSTGADSTGVEGASDGSSSSEASTGSGGSETTGDGSGGGGDLIDPCAKLLHVQMRPQSGEASDRLIMVEALDCEKWVWDHRIEVWRGGALEDLVEIPWVPAGGCAAIGGSEDFDAAPVWVPWTIAETVADFSAVTIYLKTGDQIVDGVTLPGDIFVEQGDQPQTEVPVLPVRATEWGKWVLALPMGAGNCEPFPE